MRERNYGRIVLTTSSSGLSAIFGQAIMARRNRHGRIDERARRGRPQDRHPRQHHLADRATRMTEELLPPQAAGIDEARGDHAGGGISPQRGRADPHHHGRRAGSFAVIKILESEGINLAPSEWTPDAVAAHFQEISDMSKAKALESAIPADAE